MVYYALLEHQKALSDFTKAIQINGKDSKRFFNRGRIYCDMERYQDGITDFSKAIDLTTHRPVAEYHHHRGISYFNIKKYDKALDDFNISLQNAPKNAESLYYKGLTEAALGHHELALSFYNQSIELDAENAQVFYAKGNSEFELKKFTEALKSYNIVLAFPTQPKGGAQQTEELHLKIGHANKNLEQFDIAETSYTKAIFLNARNFLAYHARGKVRFERKQYSSAISDYDVAIELAPADNKSEVSSIYHNRGTAKKAMNDKDGACTDYSTAAEMGLTTLYDEMKDYCNK